MGFIVAVDGTAGSGKGTITKIIAEKLNLSQSYVSRVLKSAEKKLKKVIRDE